MACLKNRKKPGTPRAQVIRLERQAGIKILALRLPRTRDIKMGFNSGGDMICFVKGSSLATLDLQVGRDSKVLSPWLKVRKRWILAKYDRELANHELNKYHILSYYELGGTMRRAYKLKSIFHLILTTILRGIYYCHPTSQIKELKLREVE